MYLGKLKNEKELEQFKKDYFYMTIAEMMKKYDLKKHEVTKITTKNKIYKRCDYWTKEELELAKKGVVPEGRTKEATHNIRKRKGYRKITTKKWSESEIKYLKENWTKMSDDEIAKELRRYPGSIKNKRYSLGLQLGTKWTDIEKEVLRNCTTLEECERRLPNRTIYAIKHMITRLGIKFSNKRYTYPHQLVNRYLNEMSLAYINKKRIGKFIIDCFIPSLNICIEVNGLYWHSFKNVKERDKLKSKYLKESGYKFIIIKEEETKSKKVVINKIMKEVVNCWETLT